MALKAKHTLIALFLFLGINTWVIAQTSANTPLIDSLSQTYGQNLYTNPIVAKKAAQDWLKESKRLKIDLQTVRAHYALGNLGNISGDYKSAIKETKAAITLLKALNITNGLAACYNILALGYKNLGDYPNAMDSFIQCLSYAKANDDKVQEANAYQNIATLYVLQKNIKKQPKT